ncbi:MAG: two-component regulator propeller domain-containing protein [Bacteroidales bacterium]
MKRLFIILFIFSSIIANTFADAGTWRTHLAYSAVTDVAETPTKVFGLSDGALYSYDKTSSAIVVYSKVNGLNDNRVSLISYSPDNNLLMIVYDNSNIDLMYENGTISNISDIKDNNLALNKTINRINYSGNQAYLSTAYGVTVIDLTRKEVSASYLLKKKVFATTIFNGNIYAATDQGIVSVSQSANLFDTGNWVLINTLKAVDLAVFQNTLLAVVNGSGLYSITPSSYQLIKTSTVFANLFVANNILVVYGLSQLSYYTTLAQETAVSGTNFYKLSALNPAISTWHATSTSGINRIDKSGSSYTKVSTNLKPVGPFANSPYKLRFSGKKLMIVGGGAWDDRYNTTGLMMFFDNESWSYFRLDTIRAQGSSVRDLTDIVEDPLVKGHYFVASFGEGVYEFNNNKLVKIHDHLNSGIETVNLAVLKGANHFDRTYGLCYDANNNLLISNSFTVNVIKVFTSDRTWTSLNYSSIVNNDAIFDIIQSKNGTFWTLAPWSKQGVLAFDPKGTYSNQSDDQSKFYSSLTYLDKNGDQKSVTPDNFFTISEDKNGSIWLGTNVGPFVLEKPENIFNSNYLFSRVQLPPTAGSPNPGYLLEEENIRTISVDSENRKWIGTELNGVYLVSADGKQVLFHFTESNSPLPSNRILSMAIHPTTGEIFIGTDKGLASYRNDALSTQKSFTEVYATPNPVKPDYSGFITIFGLKTDASLRITNQKGDNVYEGSITEPQLNWDGKDKTGKRVPTGIYTVYASTSESLEELVTKIVVVR